jgi:hypothetical protein
VSGLVAAVSSRPVYRLLYKRLGLPRARVHGWLSWARGRALGAELDRRRALAAVLPTAASLQLDPEDALLRFESGTLPGADAATVYCRALHDDFLSSGAGAAQLQRNPRKRFLLSVLSGNEFLAHPSLLRFMVARPILDAASRYLGAVPRLEGAALWWTPPNDSVQSSQKAHVDELAPRQVKIILHCDQVEPDCGPLFALEASQTAQVLARSRQRRGRLDDDWLAEIGVLQAMRPVLGPAGSGILFDSSRCLHFGSRGNRRDRLVLAFHFLPADAPVHTRYHLACAARQPGLDDLDEHQRLALWSALE